MPTVGRMPIASWEPCTLGNASCRWNSTAAFLGYAGRTLGPGLVNSDTLMRQIGLRRGCQEAWDTLIDGDLRTEILAYAEGVNGGGQIDFRKEGVAVAL